MLKSTFAALALTVTLSGCASDPSYNGFWSTERYPIVPEDCEVSQVNVREYVPFPWTTDCNGGFHYLKEPIPPGTIVHRELLSSTPYVDIRMVGSNNAYAFWERVTTYYISPFEHPDAPDNRVGKYVSP